MSNVVVAGFDKNISKENEPSRNFSVQLKQKKKPLKP
jgi:hypothetical protein